MLKNFLIFTAGLSIGASATYITMKKVMVEKMKKDSEESSAYWEKYWRDNETSLREKLEDYVAGNEGKSEPITKVTPQQTIYSGIDTNKVDYTAYSASNIQKAAESASPKEEPPAKPYIITPQQYGEENLHYDKINLSYYTDGVLATMSDEPYDLNLVGAPETLKFGMYEPEVVHVRNDSLAIDFEIALERISYSGYFEEG